MFSKPLSVLVLLVLIALTAESAQQIPGEKPAAAPQDFSQEAYVIERSSTRVTAENDGTGMREVTAEVRVLADAGVKAFAVLNFTYTSDNEVVEFDYVRVRKPDGTVVKTPDFNIQDMPAEVTRTAPLYSDIHAKHVAVKGLSVGDVLEYLVRVRVVKPQVPGHFWQEYSFTKSAIARDERLEISIPLEKYVKVVSPEFKPEVKQEGTRRVYRWTHTNLVVVRVKDPDEPPRRTPPNPDVQVTTFASWEDVGRWYGGLQKDPLQVTDAIQGKAAELTKGLKSDDEKIHAIYNFVSLKFHYIGLDFGIGRYQPHPASDILDNGYGDCKDKHTLLASLLKATGIEAWPALIHVQRKLDPEVPSPAQFNHVITVVPSGGQLIWLDTTPEVAPYGLLVLGLRDKQALVIPPQKPPVLMTTPQNSPFPQEQEFSMQGKLDADGTFTGHAEQSYRGDAEVVLRMLFRQYPQSQWKEAAQRFSYGMNFGGDVSNVKATPPDELDKAFELSYDYVRKKYADWENRQIVAPLPPLGIEVLKDAKDKKPVEPMPLGALGKIVYRSRVQLPPGYLATAPPQCRLDEPYATFSDDTRIENGVMTTNRVLVVKKTEVALGEWEGFRKFGRAVADDEFNYIRLSGASATGAGKGEHSDKEETGAALNADDMFREGTSAMQQRDFRRAQELFERVIVQQPKYKGAHFNLGGALMAQGRVDDALEQFRKEQAVSPDDQRSYQIPAVLLTQMGRNNDAMTEWRKLLNADPQNRTAAGALSGLLFLAGKYSDAAVVLEAAVKAAPDSPSLQLQLGQVYLKTGDKEKALTHIRAGVEQKGDDPMTLNDVAYTLAENKLSLDLAREWAEKAVDVLDDQAQGAASSDEVGIHVTYQLSLVWDTLGWVYFQQGDLSRAESFVRAAWLLGQEEVVGEHLGEIYQKQGKSKEAAHLYELTLAALSAPHVEMPGSSAVERVKAYKDRSAEITSRYEKLTGKKPSNEIRRLPNGEWTQTAEEQLRHMREVKVSNEMKLSGSAEFMIVFEPEKIESVRLVSGDHALDQLSGKLKAAHYQVEFPPDSGASIVRRMQVSCRATIPCTATLVRPEPSQPAFRGPN